MAKRASQPSRLGDRTCSPAATSITQVQQELRQCGHARSPENTVWRIRNDRRVSDGCKTCRRAASRANCAARRRRAGATQRPTAADSANGTKRCSRCKVLKPLGAFSVRKDRASGYSQGRQGTCKPCVVELTRLRRQRDPSIVTRMNKRAHERIRRAVFVAYGGPHPRCACCGEDRDVFLTLDHVDGDGHEHRRSLSASGRGGSAVYYDLKARGFPQGIQVLCHNCNWAKHRGICPHEAERAARGRVTPPSSQPGGAESQADAMPADANCGAG